MKDDWVKLRQYLLSDRCVYKGNEVTALGELILRMDQHFNQPEDPPKEEPKQ